MPRKLAILSMVKTLTAEASESTSQAVPQLVVLLREISVTVVVMLLVVAPQAVLLEKLILFSLETSDSRLRSGTSSNSSEAAEKSLKSELLWETMAEPRVSPTFSSHPQMLLSLLWISMVRNSTEEPSDSISQPQAEVVPVAAAVASVAVEATEVASVAVEASEEATEVASVAEVASEAEIEVASEVAVVDSEVVLTP